MIRCSNSTKAAKRDTQVLAIARSEDLRRRVAENYGSRRSPAIQTSTHIDAEKPDLVKVGFVQFTQDAIVAEPRFSRFRAVT